jgi:hypothetical protein
MEELLHSFAAMAGNINLGYLQVAGPPAHVAQNPNYPLVNVYITMENHYF